MSGRWKPALAGAAWGVLLSTLSLGQGGTGMTFEQLGVTGPPCRIYAPARVWQGVPTDIVVFVMNYDHEAKAMDVRLETGEETGGAFDLSHAKLEQTVEVPAHGDARVVFEGITAYEGMPSDYAFRVYINGQETDESILIKTITGPWFIGKGWSIAALVVLVGGWCAALVKVMRGIAVRGRWREEGEAPAAGSAPAWAREKEAGE